MAARDWGSASLQEPLHSKRDVKNLQEQPASHQTGLVAGMSTVLCISPLPGQHHSAWHAAVVLWRFFSGQCMGGLCVHEQC